MSYKSINIHRTPLLTSWSRHITFHDDVGKLYNEFLKFSYKESIAMVQEQSPKYLRAFGSYHVKAPGSKLGRPPSQGHPGYNPDLMVMDLVKLRHDASYKAMIHELKVNKRGHQQESPVVAKGYYL